MARDDHHFRGASGGSDGNGAAAEGSAAVAYDTAEARPRVSVVIPVYNEEGLLRSSVVELHERLHEIEPRFEVILSANGCRDRTVPIAQELSERYERVRFIESDEPNYGKALRRGLLDARGELVICEEIDLCDSEFHRRALALLEAGDAELVVGSKVIAGSNDGRPLLRRLATRVINGMLQLAVSFRGSDTHGLKALRRSAMLPIVERCVLERDLFASEMVIRAWREGIRVVEIPIDLMEKRAPTVNLVRRVPNVLRDLVRLTWTIRFKG